MDTTEILDTEIKARISQAEKAALQKIARERHLKVSDIIREALREKLEAEEEKAVLA